MSRFAYLAISAFAAAVAAAMLLGVLWMLAAPSAPRAVSAGKGDLLTPALEAR